MKGEKPCHASRLATPHALQASTKKGEAFQLLPFIRPFPFLIFSLALDLALGFFVY
jgi:hypothetical protein